MSSVTSGTDWCVIYIRLSTDDQLKNNYTPEAYLADCRAKAAALGLRVYAEFIESGKGDDWELPELWKAIGLVEAGHARSLLSWDTSRLARDLGKCLYIRHMLRKHGARLLYAKLDIDDTPEGEAQANMMGVFDQYEKAKINMRTARGITEKLARRIPICNGRVNYGLEPMYDEVTGRKIGYRPHEPEASILRGIVAALETETLQAICTRLNREQIPTPDAARRPEARWGPATIRSLLKKPIYVGEYHFGETKRRRRNGAWEYERRDPSEVTSIVDPSRIVPLLTRDEVARARAAMSERRTRRRPRVAADADPYTLRGRVRCGHCGGALSTSASRGVRAYTCLRHIVRKLGVDETDERCPMPAVPAESFEAYVWRAVLDALKDHRAIRSALDDASTTSETQRRYREQVELLERSIRRCEQRIDRATDDLHDAEPGSRTAEYARSKRADYERERVELDRSLQRLLEQPPRGLTRDDRAAVETFLRDVAVGIESDRDSCGPVRQREILGRLELTVAIGLAIDASGVQLGARRRFDVDIDALVPIRNSGNESQGSYLLLRNAAPAAPLSWSVGSDSDRVRSARSA